MSKNPTKKVLIMGAGLAGLAAGFELAKKGIKVTLIEREKDIGGLARTIKVKNFKFDTGPHRWYTKNDSVNKWMVDLLKEEIIRVPRLTRIYFDKKFFNYPIKLKNALFGIGPLKALQAVIDYLFARIRARLFNPRLDSMEEGYINQFGKTLYEIFFKRYSEKLWGEDCRNISIDWVGQRTRGLNILTIIKEAFFKSKGVVSLIDEFSYPKNGIGRLADKMAEGIKKKGGEIKLGAEVTRINHGRKGINSININNSSESFSADYFISSIPLSDLVKRMSPLPPKKIKALANKLHYRDELQVVLFIKKSHITSDTWIYIHPKEIPYMRIMEMDNWSNKLSPKGTTSIVFELACNMGDGIWNKKDQEVIDLVKKSFIQEFGFITQKDIIGGYVHRVEKEYPVYHLSYKEDVNKLKLYLKEFSNMQIIGRNGTFRYNNMDHSVEMGLYAAFNILAGKNKYDIESVNIEREYLEEKKIENIEDESLESEEK